MGTLRMYLPQPHKGQIPLLNSHARFNIARMGRRFGKTKFGLALKAVPAMLNGKPVGWFAPRYRYLTDVWRDAKHLLSGVIASKSEQEKRIELITGGSIEFWSTDSPDPGRGRKYSLAIIDEAAMIRDLLDVWNKSIRPTLTDFRGQAWFLSTPKGHDDYRKLWDIAGRRPQSWARFHAPTSANPHISKDELAQARADLPELVYRQEYGAEFVDFSGAAVRREWLSYGEPPDLTDFCIGMGVDLAIGKTEQAHYTAVVVVAISPEGRVFIVDATRDRLNFNAILRLIVAMSAKWRPHCIQVEAVQFQASVVQELLRTTALPVMPAHTGSKDKLIRFIPLQKRFEEGLVTLSRYLIPEYEAELLTFPGGDLDDLVDATVYAYRAAASGAPGQAAVSGRLESSRIAQ